MDLGPPPVLVTILLADAKTDAERNFGRHSVDEIPSVGHTFSVDIEGSMHKLKAAKIEKGDHDSPVVHAERTS